MTCMTTLAIRNILAPTDLSEASERALDHAAFLARRASTLCLTLYHAAEMPDHAQPHWAFAHGHELWHQAEETARRHLRDPRRQARRGARDRRRAGNMSPRRALLGHIRATAPDLTVMATHAQQTPRTPAPRQRERGCVPPRVSFRFSACASRSRPAPTSSSRILLPTDLSVGRLARLSDGRHDGQAVRRIGPRRARRCKRPRKVPSTVEDQPKS